MPLDESRAASAKASARPKTKRVKVKVKHVPAASSDAYVAAAQPVVKPKPKPKAVPKDVPIPASKREDVARATKRAEEDRKAEKRRVWREEKTLSGHAKVWTAEQLTDPLDFLTTPTSPKARDGAPPSQKETAYERRRRRQAAKLGINFLPLSDDEKKRYPVIGKDPNYLVTTMSPGRRREVEDRTSVPREPRERPKVTKPPALMTPAERKASGITGVPGGGGFLDAVGAVWGDVETIGTGLYGTGVDYGESLYADLRDLPGQVGSLGRGRGPATVPGTHTGRIVARDALLTAGAYEAAIAEPSWLPAWMRKEIVHVDPENLQVTRGSGEIDPEDVNRAKQAWREDPLLTALLFVPVATGLTKAVSINTLRRSIAKANPGMPRSTVNRLARKESKRPGYVAAQGYGGGIPPRMLGETGVTGRPPSRSEVGRGVQRAYDFASDTVDRFLGPNARNLGRVARTAQAVTGRWGTSRRASRAVERRQRQEIAREGAVITRAENTIRKGAKRGEHQQALVAALEAPASISIREAVQIKIRHLASLEPSSPKAKLALQGQIAQLQKALGGKHIDSPEFKKALDAMVELSGKAEGLARSVMNMTEGDLLSRRNRVMSAWQEAGLLPEGVGNARGWFPHRGLNEIAPPSSMTPTGVAATGRTVGRPFVTSAVDARKRNRMKLYERAAVNTDPKVLANTLRGRIRFQKSEQGRRYLYNQGLEILPDADIPPEGFYFVRNPDALAKTIPADVRAIIENPSRFVEGDEAALRQWANEFIRPTSEGLQEWSTSLQNVRLVPAGNVHTLLADAFSSAPRGNVAAIAGLLNSASRAALIYVPIFGSRYIIRNSIQNLVLQSLTHPAAFKKVVSAVRLARKDKKLWDAIIVETGGFPSAAGLPEQAIRGVRGAQRAEKAVTGASRRAAGALSTVTDEPFRVSGWMEYANSFGFGPKRYRELLDSDKPEIKRARDTIAQMVKDDLIDFDTLTPTERESISRYLFVYPYTKGAIRWPVTYLRDHSTRTAIIGLVASQHEREGAEWGELEVGGRMVNLSWLSPISTPQEIAANALEVGRAAAKGRADWSAAADVLAPTYQDLITSGGRGGMPFQQLAQTFVPGWSTYEQLAPADYPLARGEDVRGKVDRFLGLRPYRYAQSTKAKAGEWGEQAAEVFGSVSPGIVEAKAAKEEYESKTRGKSEAEKVQWLADFYLTQHPEKESRRAAWTSAIEEEDSDGLKQWKTEFTEAFGWENVTAIDSRMEVVEDLDAYLKKHPENAARRADLLAAIGAADDEELSEWRKELGG